MPPNRTRRQSARLLILALAVGLPALVISALACGPSAPAGQEQQLPLCNVERQDPEADGCIKPTEPPTNTPEPTPTTPLEVAPPRSAEDVPATPTPAPSLDDQIMATVASGDYDAIARVKVLSHSYVIITPTEKNFIARWTRSRLEVIETLRGNLPATLDIVTPTGAPNSALDVSGNYVLFLRKSFVDAGSSQYPDDPTRTRLNQAELAEFGGAAYIYLGRQAWAVNGATVHRIPSKKHLVSYEAAVMTDLEVARANGETKSLAALEGMLRPADN